ncbi:hypothetical protein [Bacillus mycoides]|uniref:hypothetical protein n=1 Tax=Bacillus mycoides TaxID=1405 RepID=UPI0011A7912A|nr:hypothetical protein [Bacillus mycoides]
MSIKNLKVLNKKGSVDLPDWIQFAFELGTYINDHGLKYKKATSIILSLPNEHFFGMFIAMGIADKTFSINKQMQSIKKKILSLSKGSRIIYRDGEVTRKLSVISVERNPACGNEMSLKVKDKNFIRWIPERQWLDRVILLDEEFDEIKRTRKVSKKQQLGLDNNMFLKKLYSPNQLKKAVFYTGDRFYLIGNTTMISESMCKDIFEYEGVRGAVKDFIYLDNSNSYTNGKFFSSQMKKRENEINEEVPVIYLDLNSYIKQQKQFLKNPKVIISSRTDNENRIYQVKEELKRELLQGSYKIVTEEIVGYLKSTNVHIPYGIELFAWR